MSTVDVPICSSLRRSVPLGPPTFLTGSNSTPPCHRHLTNLTLNKPIPLFFYHQLIFLWDSWNYISYQSPCFTPYTVAYLLMVFLSNMRTDAMTNLFTVVLLASIVMHGTENELNKCLLSELMLKWLNCPIYTISTKYRNHFTHSFLNSMFIKHLLCAKICVRGQGDKVD